MSFLCVIIYDYKVLVENLQEISGNREGGAVFDADQCRAALPD